ncbi:MAG: hypothetical protein N2645_00075, partial [Clostridia bacterium]|nr:hypothetical protein [Clostridia bacterium]
MQFNSSTIQNINNVLNLACQDGRNTLYEYEVYRILKEVGLEVPRFEVVANPGEVDSKMLETFGEE